jgi:hypothetical protein
LPSCSWRITATRVKVSPLSRRGAPGPGFLVPSRPRLFYLTSSLASRLVFVGLGAASYSRGRLNRGSM